MHYWQVLAHLERLRDLLVDRRNLIVNLSAEEKGLNVLLSSKVPRDLFSKHDSVLRRELKASYTVA
jgi:hypothetical protein